MLLKPLAGSRGWEDSQKISGMIPVWWSRNGLGVKVHAGVGDSWGGWSHQGVTSTGDTSWVGVTVVSLVLGDTHWVGVTKVTPALSDTHWMTPLGVEVTGVPSM